MTERLACTVALVAVGFASSAGPADETFRAPSPGVRNGHVLAYDADAARVVLFGGADEGKVLGDLWAWDGRRWSQLASDGPPPRTFPSLSYDRRRKRLVLFGGNRVLFGRDGGGDTTLRDMWEWYEGSWHEVAAQVPGARAEAAMADDRGRRRLVLFGGYRGSGSTRERLGDTWEYDGSRWMRVATNVGPSPRNGAAMAYDEDRRR
ncbi:MAG TPA: kelch repeat-containing protein, partial [Actinomycetota bacterium]|nr:kelch repeat-containing protein [Actinomycetota bacterium]